MQSDCFEKGNDLAAADARKSFEEIVDRLASFEVFDQRLYRHARPREHRRSAHDPRRTDYQRLAHAAYPTRLGAEFKRVRLYRCPAMTNDAGIVMMGWSAP